MSEKEIRAALQQVCNDLDLKARATPRGGKHRIMFPLVLGAGMAIAACGDDVVEPEAPAYGAPSGQSTTTTSDTGGGGAGGETSTGGGVTGGGGAGGLTGGGGAGAEGGMQVDYMAPDPD